MICLKDLLVEKKDVIPDDEIKERSWVLVFCYKPSLHILLAKDEKGKWSFPGGQLNNKETSEEAAWRELKEETSISPEKIDFLKTIYHDKPHKLKVSHVFYTEVPKNTILKPHSDVEKLKWVPLDDLPSDLSKPKREAIDLASAKVHDPKKEVKESIAEGLERGLPFELLTESKRKTANGYLVVFEGIDGSGKSTQRKILKKWLEGKGWKVTTSKWSTSPRISELIKDGKEKRWLTPTLYSLLHASDMVWRYENEIKPALEKGHVVLCDRYYYTSYIRDQLRGIKKEMLDEIYKNFIDPDLIIHFTVSPRLAVERLMKDKGFKWYNSGMDIGYNEDMEKCASIYETKMDEAYMSLLPSVENYTAVSAERSIREIFEDIRGFIHKKIKALERGRVVESSSMLTMLKNLLTETLSFGQLLTQTAKIPYATSPGETRVDRGETHVKARSMRVMAMENNEAWTFNYKSDLPTSTTNTRYHGFVKFMKENVESKDDAIQLDCMVDCDCPDYRYRWAYNNAKAGSGTTGAQAGTGWHHHNDNNGGAPRKVGAGGIGDYGTPGLCKHLCSLSEFLKTKIDPVAPDPKDEPVTKTVPVQKTKPTPSVEPQTSDAPDPDDYSDSRAGSDTLQEGNGTPLYERIEAFVRTNPQFNVPYED